MDVLIVTICILFFFHRIMFVFSVFFFLFPVDESGECVKF